MSELNAHVTDEEIEQAIDHNDDPDHPDATTVERVRELLAVLDDAAENGWRQYCDNIGDAEWTVVGETDELIILDTGQRMAFDQELRLLDLVDYDEDRIETSIISEIMHGLANKHCDRKWPATYPHVVAKPESFEAGQGYVEAVVNGLQQRGLTPGQAWAYYGVEIRGESRNRWGKRKGDHDHKNVSDALDKAKRKLP